MTRVYVKTLGCKVNKYDGDAIIQQCRNSGFEIAKSENDADLTIFNSCSVTENASKELRYLARKLRRTNPNSKIAVTGCYAQIDSQTLTEQDSIDFVIPNSSKDRIINLLSDTEANFTNKLPNEETAVKANRQSHFKTAHTLFENADPSTSRAFLKIQDGCNGFCAYCQIPYARGASRSVSVEKVLEECTRLVNDLEIPEIILAGIHLGDYGKDLAPATSLAAIIEAILRVSDTFRLRISSLEPMEITEELLATFRQHKNRICAHFHLPLQSGSDPVLKRMGRTYTTSEFKEKVVQLKDIFDNLHLSTDVIPGFPGETEEDFRDTLEFIRTCGFHTLHVFPYSKRPNTRALRMPDHVNDSIIHRRASEMRRLSTKLFDDYVSKQINRREVVVWERSKNSRELTGVSGNYLKVRLNQIPETALGKLNAQRTSTVQIRGKLDQTTCLASLEGDV